MCVCVYVCECGEGVRVGVGVGRRRTGDNKKFSIQYKPQFDELKHNVSISVVYLSAQRS